MNTFIEAYLKEMDKIKKQADLTIAQIPDEQLYWTPDHENNSIGVLVQHISGNINSRSTDFLTTDGEKASRDRDGEFEAQNLDRQKLLENWAQSWALFYETVRSLSVQQLDQNVSVKGKEMSVTSALLAQLVHYSGHIAQMMVLGKLLLQDQWQTLSIPKQK